MEAELGMYKRQVDLFKSDIEENGRAMQALRKRWVAEQRRARKQTSSGQSPPAPAWESKSGEPPSPDGGSVAPREGLWVPETSGTPAH